MDELRTNRKHFHIWAEAKTGRAFFKLARGYDTRQTANNWAKRLKPDTQTMVLQCDKWKCQPPLE